jgi:thiol-disulfide isomerase/thioredoxin
MFMMKRLAFLGASLACLTAITTSAARIGDPAAALAVKEWVKGKQVDVKDGKNIYVVEFWATWCPPCRTSIPHLTEIQKNFKDKGVVVIGISDETADKVKPFVEKQAEKMEYVVAIDEGGKCSKGYMEAFGQGGIPHAFIVGKDGKVIWHGHPMDGLDKALEEITAGKYDLAAAQKKDEARAAMDDYQKLAREGDAKAKELGKKLLADQGNDPKALCDFAFAIVTDMRSKNRDFALGEEALDKAEKAAGGKTAQILGVRAIARFENGKQEDGVALIKEAVAMAKEGNEKQQYERWQKAMESRKNAPKKETSK